MFFFSLFVPFAVQEEEDHEQEAEEQEGEDDENDGGMNMMQQNSMGGGPRGMPPMAFMPPPGMNFSPGMKMWNDKSPAPLLPTPPGGPIRGVGGNGSWNGPPGGGPGGNFPRGGGFFGGDRMRSPPFPIQPPFNFRPGMNMRGIGRPPRGRPHPFRGNPMFRGGGGGGNRGGRGGNW